MYSTEYGVYQPHCGLDNVMLSWGHDEVRVTEVRSLPFMLTFSHSICTTSSKIKAACQRQLSIWFDTTAFTREYWFRLRLCPALTKSYRWHREGAYMHLTNAEDERALEAVRAFNPYDLYSKSDEPVDPEQLKPYYQGLIAKFFPPVIEW